MVVIKSPVTYYHFKFWEKKAIKQQFRVSFRPLLSVLACDDVILLFLTQQEGHKFGGNHVQIFFRTHRPDPNEIPNMLKKSMDGDSSVFQEKFLDPHFHLSSWLMGVLSTGHLQGRSHHFLLKNLCWSHCLLSESYFQPGESFFSIFCKFIAKLMLISYAIL